MGANPGTISGTLGTDWATGLIGSSLNFTGSDKYVNVADSASLDMTSAISIGMWAYPTTINTNNQMISKRSSYDATGIPFEINMFTGGKISFRVVGNDLTDGAIAMSVNNWYYVLCTWDGSVTKVYINAVLDVTGASTGPITPNNTAVAIGNLPGGAGGEGFTGRLDEVAIWTRALSSTEATQLYNSGVGLQYPFNRPSFRANINGGTKLRPYPFAPGIAR